MKRASSQRLQEERERPGKCRHRLSKTLGRGKDEPPGDRGDCEKESTTQGSE